jgi:hypothetical protein
VGRWRSVFGLVTTYFVCPLTIHYGERIWHHSGLFDGESVISQGVITDLFERGGNSTVWVQVSLTTCAGRPVASIEHESIYQLARAKASE